MIREAAELGRLLIGPVLGANEERGDGRVVMVIPGLFSGDFYLEPLRAWLRRIGYTAIRSTLTVNAGCLLRLRDQVQAQLVEWQRRKTGPLALIGHSRGGVIAWSIAAQMGETVSHLALLGSPLTAYRQSATSGQDVPRRTPMGRVLGQASNFARRMFDPDCDFRPAIAHSFVILVDHSTPRRHSSRSSAATMKSSPQSPVESQQSRSLRLAAVMPRWPITPRFITRWLVFLQRSRLLHIGQTARTDGQSIRRGRR
jgi:pimeloyl-ACP methyl ester carboxylesterase